MRGRGFSRARGPLAGVFAPGDASDSRGRIVLQRRDVAVLRVQSRRAGGSTSSETAASTCRHDPARVGARERTALCAHHLRTSATELGRSCTRRPWPPERATWRAWMGRAHRDPLRQHGRPGRPRTRGDRLAGAVIVQPAAGAISSPARALRRAARWREARAGPWRARRASPAARRPPEGAREHDCVPSAWGRRGGRVSSESAETALKTGVRACRHIYRLPNFGELAR